LPFRLTVEYTDHAAIFCRSVRYIEKKFLEKKLFPHVEPSHVEPVKSYLRFYEGNENYKELKDHYSPLLKSEKVENVENVEEEKPKKRGRKPSPKKHVKS